MIHSFLPEGAALKQMQMWRRNRSSLDGVSFDARSLRTASIDWFYRVISQQKKNHTGSMSNDIGLTKRKNTNYVGKVDFIFNGWTPTNDIINKLKIKMIPEEINTRFNK